MSTLVIINNLTNYTRLAQKIKGGIMESWLDERGHSLAPLSNPGFKLEMGLESGEHGTLLGR